MHAYAQEQGHTCTLACPSRAGWRASASVVALARKLLIAIWHVLHERQADRHADADQVAFKLMVWSWKLTDEQRGGLTTRQFVRYQLIGLKLGDNLTHVVRGGAKRLIAPPEEVLVFRLGGGSAPPPV